LIEPPPDDALMFDTSMMSFSSRIEIARHGFESVTQQLAGDFERVSGICARHGLALSATQLEEVLAGAGVEDPAAGSSAQVRMWRRILEQTTATLLRQSNEAPD